PEAKGVGDCAVNSAGSFAQVLKALQTTQEDTTNGKTVAPVIFIEIPAPSISLPASPFDNAPVPKEEGTLEAPTFVVTAEASPWRSLLPHVWRTLGEALGRKNLPAERAKRIIKTWICTNKPVYDTVSKNAAGVERYFQDH
ncbi:unnamed protein product, partial [Amoebophrya sp. A25]